MTLELPLGLIREPLSSVSLFERAGETMWLAEGGKDSFD